MYWYLSSSECIKDISLSEISMYTFFLQRAMYSSNWSASWKSGTSHRSLRNACRGRGVEGVCVCVCVYVTEDKLCVKYTNEKSKPQVQTLE